MRGNRFRGIQLIAQVNTLVSGKVSQYLNKNISDAKARFSCHLGRGNGMAKLEMKVDDLFGGASIPLVWLEGNIGK